MRKAYCALCGSKGGFVNNLVAFICSPYGDVLYECEWCIAGARVSA
jgi:hypothetical protein